MVTSRRSPIHTTQRPLPARPSPVAQRAAPLPEDFFETYDEIVLTSPDEDDAQGLTDLGATSLYFKVDAADMSVWGDGAQHSVRLSIHYLDVGTDVITVEYSSNGTTANQTKTLVTKTNTGDWLWKPIHISNMRLSHSVYASFDNADFRVYSSSEVNVNAVRLRETTVKIRVDWKGSLFDEDLQNQTAFFGLEQDLVGPWELSEYYLIYDTGTNAESMGMSPADYPFYAGATYANRASAVFYVTPAGLVHASAGDIANWNIGVVDAYTISADSGKIKLNSQTPSISLGESVASSNAGYGTGKGIWMGKYGASDWRFRVGDPVTAGAALFSFDNTDILLKNAGLEVYNGATQTGNINKTGSAWFGSSSSNKTIQWWTTGATANDVQIGGTGNNIYWDDFAATMLLVGALSLTGTITVGGAVVSDDYVAGSKGWKIGAAGKAEFKDIEARGEFHAGVFVSGTIKATAGSEVIAKSAGTLKNAVTTQTSPTTFNVDIKDPPSGHAQLFAASDILRLKDENGHDVWATVSSVSDQTTFYRYVCTKSNGTNATFNAGTTVIDYGQSGQGFLYLTADDSNGPFYSVRTHAGSPWSSTTERGRFGNMNGAFGVSGNYYGFGAGDYSAGNYIKYDTNGGFAVRGQTSTGSMAFGNPPPTSATVGSGIYVDYTGVYGLASNVQQFYLQASDGKAYAGAGAVVLDALGISVSTSSSTPRFKFMSGTTQMGYMNIENTGGYGYDGDIRVSDLTSGKSANWDLLAESAASDVTFYVEAGGSSGGNYANGSASVAWLNGTNFAGLVVGAAASVSIPASDVRLHVANGIYIKGSAPVFYINDTAGNGVLFKNSSNILKLTRDGGGNANLMSWDTANVRVGIGNASPATPLDVTGAATISGTTYIGDTSNANVTLGLTINQGANDDSILELKSSDVAHGVTTQTETDTYALFRKFNANNGGLDILGFDDTAGTGVRIGGVVTTANTTFSTSGLGAIILDGYLKSGTGVTSLGTDGNLVAVRNSGTMRFSLDGDGDSHQDVGTAWTNFDEHDDVALLNKLSAHVTRRDDPLRESFGDWLQTNRKELEQLRLVKFNKDGHHFMNMSRLTMLLVGAVRQLDNKLKRLESGS